VGSRWASGDPDEMFGRIRLADVVLAIRDLEPGFHTQEEVRARYYALTGQTRNADERQVSAIVTRFGLRPFVREGERGWHIDPARLAERWPRLPWTD
jgi:hypothetical protein